jgi:hypothetical protein
VAVTWDGTTTDLDKITQLAELAGHRNVWSSNTGVITSISAQTYPGQDIIKLDDLLPTAESIIITEQYLTAPNRIIVTDNASTGQVATGVWDAPASAPHSFANIGYYRTETASIQGLGSVEHAQAVAQAIGENYTARKLDAEIQPTYLLDGPVQISYDDALWLVQSWSVGTDANSLMTVSCQELVV